MVGASVGLLPPPQATSDNAMEHARATPNAFFILIPPLMNFDWLWLFLLNNKFIIRPGCAFFHMDFYRMIIKFLRFYLFSSVFLI